VYGLGSNDAKASVAAMVAAFLRLREKESALKCRVMLTLVVEEETGGKSGKGTELLLAELGRRGLMPQAVLVGEPTGLDLAVAQKGLLVLEMRAEGQACHAAHGRALGAVNAVRKLARDLMAIDRVDLGPPHPRLGPVTVEPTVIAGGTARNMIPAEASCFLDVRTNPQPDQAATAALLRSVLQGELRVVSDRLSPCEIDPNHLLVRAAQRARPSAALFGSRGLSDMVFFAQAGIPALKVGPGETERSHTPDEFVLESEVLAGGRFYEDAALAFGELAALESPAPLPAQASAAPLQQGR
jgi:acetylornithine deacetylase